MDIFSIYSYEYGNPILRINVDYVTSTDDYVGDSDKGSINLLEVIARNRSEYSTFFKLVERLMSKQCDCPAGGDDLHIHLSPVFRVTVYRNEDEFISNSPRTYSFVKFFNKFYERVHKFRCSS